MANGIERDREEADTTLQTVSALHASPINQREITIKEFYHLDEMDVALRDFVLSLRA